MPSVSIITAAYNHEKYIAQAIESVLAQTFQDWEYIIWDDGSSDRTLDIAQNYSKKFPSKIKVFHHEKRRNFGQEATRNLALERAQGEFISLLDSDDFFHPQKLEWLLPCLKDASVGLAFGQTAGAINTKIPHHIYAPRGGFVFNELICENFIGAASVLVRRKCFQSHVRFDSTFKTCGEYPLWLNISKKWRFTYVPKVVCTWRNHGGNVGTKLKLKAKEELVRLTERFLKEAHLESATRIFIIQQSLLQRKYDLIAEAFSEGDLTQLRSQAFSLLQDPQAATSLKIKSAILFFFSLFGNKLTRPLAFLKKKYWNYKRMA